MEGTTPQRPNSIQAIGNTSTTRLAPLTSPTKGILLTPGTGAARRKTVSFGKLVLEDNPQLSNPGNGNHDSGTSQASMSKKQSKGTAEDQRTQANLRRTLFVDAQKISVETREKSSDSDPTVGVLAEVESQQCDHRSEGIAEEVTDITIDLKQPRSKSGQHWKREYQRDHEASKREMRKLIQHNQVTKSYAAKKDRETTSLSAKLQKALQRVDEMESRVSELAAQLADKQTKDNPSPSGALLSELATQTAQVLRCKQKAQRYQQAIARTSLESAATNEHGRADIPKQARSEEQQLVTAHTNTDADDLVKLQEVAASAGIKVAELERENEALKSTLARVKQEMKGYEIRHQAREERRKRKDEKAEAQKQTLKKQLRQARDDIQRLQLSTQDSGSHLQSRDQDPTTGGLSVRQQKDSIMSESIDIWNDLVGPTLNTGKEQANAATLPRTQASRQTTRSQLNAPPARLNQTISDPGHTYSFKTLEREQNSKLVDPSQMKESSFVLAVNREKSPFSLADLPASLHPPHLIANNAIDSIATAKVMGPPLRPSPLSGLIGLNRKTTSLLAPSSRASSMSTRTPLPPDRAAAAKLRLEQRNAERQKSVSCGKENLTP